jgi:hypothetical protein
MLPEPQAPCEPEQRGRLGDEGAWGMPGYGHKEQAHQRSRPESQAPCIAWCRWGPKWQVMHCRSQQSMLLL